MQKNGIILLQRIKKGKFGVKNERKTWQYKKYCTKMLEM